MKIFDKAQWHIDGGEDKTAVIEKFKAVFAFLEEQNFLNADGLEILGLGIDGSISLNANMLTDEGREFLSDHYDEVINCSADEIAGELAKRIK